MLPSLFSGFIACLTKSYKSCSLLYNNKVNLCPSSLISVIPVTDHAHTHTHTHTITHRHTYIHREMERDSHTEMSASECHIYKHLQVSHSILDYFAHLCMTSTRPWTNLIISDIIKTYFCTDVERDKSRQKFRQDLTLHWSILTLNKIHVTNVYALYSFCPTKCLSETDTNYRLQGEKCLIWCTDIFIIWQYVRQPMRSD